MEKIGLNTFPDDDKDYCKYFEVEKDWLIHFLKKNNGMDIEEFLNDYIWDETWFIYYFAKGCNKLICEREM
jgi:hypothetical protein